MLSSDMAAIITTLLGVLKAGDHVVCHKVQESLGHGDAIDLLEVGAEGY